MTVFHFFKADCFGASRITLQSGWDNGSCFVHRPRAASELSDARVESRVLSMFEVFRIVWEVRRESSSFVFHGQATLPYLLAAYVSSRFMQKARIRIVYDMHDLHERWKYEGLADRIRYGVFRYFALRSLEKIVFRLSKIYRMTVSNGLASVVAQKYECSRPEVVRSAPPPVFAPEVLQCMSRSQDTILYFGLLDHAPLELINAIGEAGFKIDLFGRDITMESLSARLGYEIPSFVNVCGSYSPEKMDFLEEYAFLMLYKPEVRTLNYMYALPNKLFQSLGYGVSVLYSGNFVELGEFIGTVDGAGAMIETESDLSRVLRKLSKSRDSKYFSEVVRLSGEANEESRKAYLKVVFGGTDF